MRSVRVLAATCFIALSTTALPTLALTQPPSPEKIVQGLGERFPAAKDISKSPDFHVYKFRKDGITYIQVNRLDGQVVAAIAGAEGHYSALPIGSLPIRSVIMGGANPAYFGAPPQPSASGDGQCPCGGQVVYSGPDGTIVVVTDRNGNVIQVIFIPRTARQ